MPPSMSLKRARANISQGSGPDSSERTAPSPAHEAVAERRACAVPASHRCKAPGAAGLNPERAGPLPSPDAGMECSGYKAAFWPTLRVMLGWSALPFLMLVPLLFGFDLWQLGRILLAITVLDLIAVAVYVHSYPVNVQVDGITGYDHWGQEWHLPWEAISRVRPVNLLGFKFLKVHCEYSGVSLWLPLFLADPQGFRAGVARYGMPGQPLWDYFHSTSPGEGSALSHKIQSLRRLNRNLVDEPVNFRNEADSR